MKINLNLMYMHVSVVEARSKHEFLCDWFINPQYFIIVYYFCWYYYNLHRDGRHLPHFYIFFISFFLHDKCNYTKVSFVIFWMERIFRSNEYFKNCRREHLQYLKYSNILIIICALLNDIEYRRSLSTCPHTCSN